MDTPKSTENKIRWRIYYADGSAFSSEDGLPHHAPGTGVIVIAQINPLQNENPHIQHMTDYYIWLGSYWLGCDLFRVWQYLFVDNHLYDFPRAVLAGETVMNDDFLAIRMKAKSDPDIFPDRYRDIND